MVFQGVLQSHPQKQNGLVNQVDFGGLRHTLTTVKHFVSDPLKKRYGCLSRDKKTFTIVGEVLCNLEISLVFARISLRISTLLIRAFLTRRCVWAGHETIHIEPTLASRTVNFVVYIPYIYLFGL